MNVAFSGSSLVECELDVLRYLRDLTDGERCAIGARACARVRAAHTAAHRAADLERYARS